MTKKEYITPDIKIKQIGEENLLAASISEKPEEAPTIDDGGDVGAKPSLWNKFDNEE